MRHVRLHRRAPELAPEPLKSLSLNQGVLKNNPRMRLSMNRPSFARPFALGRSNFSIEKNHLRWIRAQNIFNTVACPLCKT